MKTKLLRKVRKRYQIYKVYSLNYNDSNFYHYNKKLYGLPFYVLIDKKDSDNFKRMASSDYYILLDYLQRMIKLDYEKIVRKTKREQVKVWHNPKLMKQIIL